MPTTERPYRQEPLEQLRRLVHTARRHGDANGLRVVVHELGLRTTRAAASLLGEAQTALTSLGSRAESTARGGSGAAHPDMALPSTQGSPEAVPQGAPE